MGSLSEFIASLDTAAMLSAVLRIVAVILCLTVHESCHGLAAYALGDSTARAQHRISLNPLHHIDWMGLAAMVILGFGWAKPVNVDMRHFKDPKRGMALTALAGPMSNLLLAAILLLLARLLWAAAPDGIGWALLLRFLILSAQLSVGLGVFNLIPLPPLDGSRILSVIVPEKWNYYLNRYQTYIQIALIALLYTGILSGPLSTARNWLILQIETAVRWILQTIL